MGKALIDANIVVALYRSDDSLHRVAVTVVSKLKESDWKFIFTNLLFQETATVLSMRVGMNLAKKFLQDHSNLIDEIIFVDEEVEKLSWRIFSSQTKKGTSFVDCSNLAVIEKFSLDGIVSFDKFYPKKLLIR